MHLGIVHFARVHAIEDLFALGFFLPLELLGLPLHLLGVETQFNGDVHEVGFGFFASHD